jgi:hypothetical protein
MEEKYTQLLDDYFNDLLDPEGRKTVEDLVATEPGFQQEFNLRQKMEHFARVQHRRAQLDQQLTQLNQKYFKDTAPVMEVKRPMRVGWRKIMLAAASVAILAAALWWLQKPTGTLYEQYAAHEMPQFTVRSSGANLSAEAEQAFKQKNYATALEKLSTLLAEEPNDANYQLYQAICLIELNRSAEARIALQPLADGKSALKSEAVWYLALSYLKEQNNTACQTILMQISAGDIHYKDAEKLIKALK